MDIHQLLWLRHSPHHTPYPVPYVTRNINNADGNVEYIGYAPRGSQTSEKVWVIEKLFYDTDKRYTHSLESADKVIFDNYATETYT